MKTAYKYWVVLVLILALRGWGAEQEFYRAFLSMVDTNSAVAVAIKSPGMVDTNNTGPKLKDVTISLRSSITNSDLGGIRLGMTMEQVVGRWGKPQHFWSRCGGGPRFMYKDVSVTFEPAANCATSITCFGPLPHFEGGLSGTAKIPEFLGVLGTPTTRYDRVKMGSSQLVYNGPSSRMDLYFDDGAITSIRLVRHSGRQSE